MGGWLLTGWCLAWAAWAGVPLLAVSTSPRVSPFANSSAGSVVLEARVNGQGPFRFLLDTGSARSIVSPRTAAAGGTPVVARTTMGSAAGTLELPVVSVETLEVGPILAPALLATVVALDRFDDGGLDGVIGHDVLAAVRYTIDFRERRVVWWPPHTSSARGPALPLRSSGGRFLLSLPQRESVLQLVPDTGASSLLLFAPHPVLPVTLLPERATLTTVSSQVPAQLALVRQLLVGELTLTDVPTAIVGRNPSEPSAVDGLLPLHLFDRVTIDGPAGQITVETGAHRDQPAF